MLAIFIGTALVVGNTYGDEEGSIPYATNFVHVKLNESKQGVIDRHARNSVSAGSGPIAPLRPEPVHTFEKGPNAGNSRIVGGEATAAGDYPFFASLSLATQEEVFMCGATLITPSVLLTAAHCFVDQDGKVRDLNLDGSRAYIGLSSMSQKYDAADNNHIEASISCFKIHEDYDALTARNDIALILLTEPAPNNWPVIVPSTSDDDTDTSFHSTAFALGFGSLEDSSIVGAELEYPDALQRVEITLIDNFMCKAAGVNFNTWVTDSMVCTMESGKDACVGDSGGPLFVVSSTTGVLTQIGITSWGVGCATPDSPGVYTRVSEYALWITANAEALKNDPISACDSNTGGSTNVPGMTVGGCFCKPAWSVGPATCSDADGIIFSGCGMHPPCDGDTGGLELQSWCIITPDESCTPVGLNWDYCVPIPDTSTSSSTQQPTTTAPTTTTTTTTTTSTTTSSALTTKNPSAGNEDGVNVLAVENGYELISNTEVCDPAIAKRASVRRLSGDGHSSLACTSMCESLYDCYFSTLDWRGVCFLFEDCEVRREKSNCQLWRRMSIPTTQPRSPTEGYTLIGQDSKCDKSIGAVPASRSSLGGGGHELGQCALTCDKVLDCKFFSFSTKGYCNLFAKCDSDTRTSGTFVTYSRDSYQLQSLSVKCDKMVRKPKSLGGSGWSEEECIAGCDKEETCAHYVWYAFAGYCHMFTHCGPDMQIEATGGSRWVSRVGGARVPLVDNFDVISRSARCNVNSDLNVRAARFSPGGGGWTADECAGHCQAADDCTIFQVYPSTGYCHLFKSCTDMINMNKHALVYQLSSVAIGTSSGIFGTSIQASTAGGIGVVVIAVSILVMWVAVKRRRSTGGAKDSGECETLERTPLTTESILPTTGRQEYSSL